MAYSSITFADLDLSENQIVHALESADGAEFEKIYKNVVIHLEEKEQVEDFESQISFTLLSTPKFSFLKTLFISGHAVSRYDDLCFFGGWMSKKGGNNKCRRPWKMRGYSRFTREHSAHVYSKEYNCGGIYFRCNPLVFGSNSSGKGKCVKYDPVKNLSARCASASTGLINNHLKSLKEDPILREKFAHYLKYLIKECRTSRGGTCEVLKGQIKKLYAKAKSTNVVQLCKAIVEPLINAKNFIDIGSRIESPPVVKRQPSNNREEEDSSTILDSTAIEDEMFRNYKKLGGDPKAFKHVMCFFKKHHQESSFKAAHGKRIKIEEKCKIMINDYTKGSNHKRLFIMNRCTGKVMAMQSSHGIGGAAGSSRNSRRTARHISNRPNTYLSPSGFFIMGGWHHTTKKWKPGIKMHGIQKGINDRSYSRGIVFHRAMNGRGGYCQGGLATSDQSNPKLIGYDCGRTHGCLGIAPSNWQVAIDNIKGERTGGPLLYTYSHIEAAKPSDYCGDNLWQ